MTREFYPKDATRFSKQIMEGLREIDAETHGISLLGGWAVFELVEPELAIESQDIDILIHNQPGWNRAISLLVEKKYNWRFIKSRDGTRERDNCLTHEFHDKMVVDLFCAPQLGDRIPQSLFGTRWIATIKDMPYEGFVPSLNATLLDKLETLPKRTDATKALKDALDARLLLLHNRQGVAPKTLLSPRLHRAVELARPRIEKIQEAYPAYLEELTDLLSVLRRQPS